jgi:large subunit ribosomal protein L30
VSADKGAGAGNGAGNGSAGHLKVTQVRSAIATKPKHRGTLRALGLRGVGRSRILPDRPEVRGMLARVPHLVVVTEAGEVDAAHQRERSAATRAARRAGRQKEQKEQKESS